MVKLGLSMCQDKRFVCTFKAARWGLYVHVPVRHRGTADMLSACMAKLPPMNSYFKDYLVCAQYVQGLFKTCSDIHTCHRIHHMKNLTSTCMHLQPIFNAPWGIYNLDLIYYLTSTSHTVALKFCFKFKKLKLFRILVRWASVLIMSCWV